MTAHQKKHLVFQIMRDATRLSILALVIVVVYMSLYAHYRAARAMEDDQLLKGVKGTVLKQIHQQVDGMEDPQAFLDQYKGTLWSMRLAGVDISDPLAAAGKIRDFLGQDLDIDEMVGVVDPELYRNRKEGIPAKA